MERAKRPRALTAGQEQRLDALRRLARLLDSAFVLPGTEYRFGLDPILGLVPGLGDLTSPLFAIALLWQSRDLGIRLHLEQLANMMTCHAPYSNECYTGGYGHILSIQ